MVPKYYNESKALFDKWLFDTNEAFFVLPKDKQNKEPRYHPRDQYIQSVIGSSTNLIFGMTNDQVFGAKFG